MNAAFSYSASGRFSLQTCSHFSSMGPLGRHALRDPFYLIQSGTYLHRRRGCVSAFILIMFLFSSRVARWFPEWVERLLLCLGAALAGLGFAAFRVARQQTRLRPIYSAPVLSWAAE